MYLSGKNKIYMPEVVKNIILKSTPNKQLYWFVNKFLSIKKITFLPHGDYDELICFQPDLLKESGLFTLGRYDPGANDDGNQEYGVLVDGMLWKIKGDVEGDIEKFRKDYGLPSDVKRFDWDKELYNMYGDGPNAFYIHLKYRPVFEAYLRYLNGDKIETKIVLQKKEQIQLPKLPKILKQNSKNQLYWFINKLIDLSKYPDIIDTDTEVFCFPVDLLRKEETGLFPLGRYEGSVIFDSEDQEYAQYCKEMLRKIQANIYKLEHSGYHFNEENFSWHEDEHNVEGYGYAFFMDRDYRPLFETYLRYMDGKKAGPKIKEDKKYSEADEDILLTLLGIRIKGDYIIRGKDKAEINPTDKDLIYYLFYKSLKNEEECFTLKDLAEAKEIKKSERYIKNRITEVNQKVKKII